MPGTAELPHVHLGPPELVEEHITGIDSPETGSAATLSQWQLIALRFSKHFLAVASLFILMVLYSLAIFAEFAAPYTRGWGDVEKIYCPPQLPKFSFSNGFYTNRIERQIDPITQKNYYTSTGDVVPLGFFVKGELNGVDSFGFSSSHTERSVAYELVNLTAGYRSERWSASVWGRNVFDAGYYPRGFFFANEPPDWVDKRYVQSGDPRRFGLTVSVDF
jgi:hypothetical protein